MKRFLALCSTIVLMLAGAFAQDFAALDAMHDQKKLDAELAGLKQLYNASAPDAAVAWRMVRCIQEMGVSIPASRNGEKIAKFDEAINFGKPLMDKASGASRDKAKVLYWYAASMSQKGKAKGVLNSLAIVPEVRSICDKAIGIDPAFGDPYYLKALIDENVPDIAGGDKGRMGALYAKAIECDPSNLWYLADCARALKTRNKDANYNKDGKRGVPSGKTDLEYAKVLAKMAYDTFAALPSPSIDQKGLVDDLRKAGL
jgi:hypothetical protein